MATRRVLEIDLDLTLRTPYDADPHDPEVCMVVRVFGQTDVVCSPRDVEAIHQFTYELLAGPTRDPRLDDARIACGFRWLDYAAGQVECCLNADHPQIGSVEHVSANGVWFEEPPF